MPLNRFGYFKKLCVIRNFFSRLNEAMQNCSKGGSNIYDLQYKHLIDISPELIFILRNDIIIYLNNSAKKLLVIEETHQIQGQSIIDFVDQEYRHIARQSIYQLINNNQDALIAEIKLNKCTGEICCVQGLAVAIVYTTSKGLNIHLSN